MTITASDAGQLIRYGVCFAKNNEVAVCVAAAQLFAIATDEEKPVVRGEFEEGVRNNVPNMNIYYDRMWQFDDWCKYFEVK